MHRIPLVCLLFLLFACKQRQQVELSPKEIVDKAIAVAGGERYRDNAISFRFRNRTYSKEPSDTGVLLKRITITDSDTITDIKSGNDLKRLVNNTMVLLADSMAIKYGNSVNSVHYFAYLPYGLNDKAVNKELLGEVLVGEKTYYKIRVTFDEQGGGDDFEDVFVYWFNKDTFKPDYLAYEFHDDGGGSRFRKAYNERYVNGIRFVDYYNYAPPEQVAPEKLDQMYEAGQLRLLSNIELRDISVISDSYN